MNYALAKEIYGDSWCVDFGSVSTFKNLLKEIRTAKHNPEEKANSFALANISIAGTSVALAAPETSRTKADKTISITNINGVITKTGGASSNGMKDLSEELVSADNDPNVIGHLFVVDSPGGSVSGMKYMQQTMASLKKPTVSLIERSGMAASAAYGIASSAKYMFAEDANSEVGSIGVISGTAGVPNGDKNGNGEVEYMIYASTAPDKNKAEEDAINHKDTSGLQARADLLHTEFQASTKASRPAIQDEQMTGAMYRAGSVVGSMVDAIGSKQDALNKVLELSKSNNTFIPKIKNNQTKAMTAAEYKAAHPTEHASIVAEGVSAERDRVGSWMAFSAADPEAVQKGIQSGNNITQTETSQLLIKMHSKNTLQALQNDSTAAIVPAPAVSTEAVLSDDENEFVKLYPKAKESVSLLPNFKNN